MESKIGGNRKMHRYFVSYTFTTPVGWGYGSTDFTCTVPITTMDQVLEMQKIIRENFKKEGQDCDVVVLHWVQFPDTPQ